jgi:hypothetical protein
MSVEELGCHRQEVGVGGGGLLWRLQSSSCLPPWPFRHTAHAEVELSQMCLQEVAVLNMGERFLNAPIDAWQAVNCEHIFIFRCEYPRVSPPTKQFRCEVYENFDSVPEPLVYSLAICYFIFYIYFLGICLQIALLVK